MKLDPREGECDLCGNGGENDELEEPLKIYPIEMPHLVAYRTWLCIGCIEAVTEYGDDWLFLQEK